jgi:hypothetical protein
VREGSRAISAATGAPVNNDTDFKLVPEVLEALAMEVGGFVPEDMDGADETVLPALVFN